MFEQSVPHKVQWFEADQNTARLSIAGDAAAVAFADAVGFTVVQPAASAAIASSHANHEIQGHVRSLGITPSPYSG